MTMTRLIAVAVLLACWPLATRAQCTASASPVSFGTYLPFSSSPTDSTGSVSVNCTFYVGAYTIALSAGNSGSFANRQMKYGSGVLTYQLYTTSARTLVWGDGSAGTRTVSGTCVVTCRNTQSVYGRIPALQAVRPGTYIDTIVATVTY